MEVRDGRRRRGIFVDKWMIEIASSVGATSEYAGPTDLSHFDRNRLLQRCRAYGAKNLARVGFGHIDVGRRPSLKEKGSDALPLGLWLDNSLGWEQSLDCEILVFPQQRARDGQKNQK